MPQQVSSSGAPWDARMTMPRGGFVYTVRRLAVVAAMVAGVLPLITQASSAATGLPCTPVLVVGARGSGEAFDPGSAGMGPTAYSAYQLLATQLGSVHTATDGIDYPAQDVFTAAATAGALYQSSVAVGVSRVAADLAGQLVSCPTQRFVLLGYSQGADVMSSYLQGLVPNPGTTDRAILARIAGISLFGDPRFNPADLGIDQGTYSSSLSGMFATWPVNFSLEGARPLYSPVTRSLVRSYCLKGDLVCNWSASNAVGCLGAGVWGPLAWTVFPVSGLVVLTCITRMR